MKAKAFLKNIVCGAVIGIAMIIPGVSGGTLAVLLNMYEQIIDAISSLRREFKKSVLFLLPIVLGAILGIAALYFPLKFFLDRAPLPTVLLFAGLMIGSCPEIIKKGINLGFEKINVLSFLLPLAAVVGICFIPGLGEADLSAGMPAYQYFLLVVIGAIASCALVIPGVSGSMLLLILGYYNSILKTVSDLTTVFGHSVLVLLCFAVGLIIGFFSIAKLMKLLLNRLPRGTYWAIIGFVVGSIPAIFLTFGGNFPDAPTDAVQITVGVILGLLGMIASFALTAFVGAKKKKNEETNGTPSDDASKSNHMQTE